MIQKFLIDLFLAFGVAADCAYCAKPIQAR